MKPIFILQHNVSILHWDILTKQQKQQWPALTKEAITDTFIGGEWFEQSFIDPDKLTNKPLLFFKENHLIGFMNPRLEVVTGDEFQGGK